MPGPHTPQPMLDWPAHIQTSPKSTSFSVMVFLPATVISDGSLLGLCAGNRTIHWPSLSATASYDLPSSVIVTFWPAAAQPQIGTSCPCWSTMPLLKMAARRTSGEAGAAAGASAADAERLWMKNKDETIITEAKTCGKSQSIFIVFIFDPLSIRVRCASPL